MEFETGLTKTYVTTVQRQVGPTTLTGGRGTLPEPAPDDSNAIWVAPNGSDANAGTQALPVLTIQHAVTILTGPKPTMVAFRNGFVGAFQFTLPFSSVIVMGANENLQANDGEIIKIDNNFTPIIMGAGGEINGFDIRVPSFSSDNVVSVTNTGAKIANCYILPEDFNDPIGVKDVALGIAGTNSSIIEYNVVASSYHCIQLALDSGAAAGSVNNNVLYGHRQLITNTVNDSGSTALTGNAGISLNNMGGFPGTPMPIFDRNLFVNCFRAFTDAGDDGQTVANKMTMDFRNCDYFNCDTAYSAHSDFGTSHNVDIIFTNCRLSVFNGAVTAGFDEAGLLSDVLDPGITVSTVDSIDPATPSLYVDEVAGSATTDGTGAVDDWENFRLQVEGKTSPNGGQFFATSPLLTAGISGVAVNPWDETTTGPTFAFTGGVHKILFPASSLTRSRPYVNPTSNDDITGGVHTAFDGRRRQFVMPFGEGDKYADNDDLRKLEFLTFDTGSIRWYPEGVGKSLFHQMDSETADAVQCVFSSADNSISPVIIGGPPMESENWAGFWAIVNGLNYRIDSNDNVKMLLSDPELNGFPTDGTYSFSIEFMLIKWDVASIDLLAKQDFFTRFLRGGTFRESPRTAVTADADAFELKGYSISFSESKGLDVAT